jgi:glutamine amidotransferase
MCRLLYVRSEKEFEIAEHLQQFSLVAKNSKEYQGHGWGCAWLENDEWKYYKKIDPIWEDDFSKFGNSSLLMVHARSAFQDKDIVIENNMPFYDEQHVFIFNGELHGVKINAEGRIGAEKIFNFIKRFNKGNMHEALEKGAKIIDKRSRYIRAMNIIIGDKKKAYVSSLFNEEKDYFTMHYKKSAAEIVICSQPYEGEDNWLKIENNSTGVF